MSIIQYSDNIIRCPFSKEIIKSNRLICLFNMKQYNSFRKEIYTLLSVLPDEIIELIIKKTNYLKYINRFGKEKYSNWAKLFDKKNKYTIQKNYDIIDSSSDDSEDSLTD